MDGNPIFAGTYRQANPPDNPPDNPVFGPEAGPESAKVRVGSAIGTHELVGGERLRYRNRLPPDFNAH